MSRPRLTSLRRPGSASPRAAGVALSLLAVTALAGCGGSSDTTDPATPGTSASSSATTTPTAPASDRAASETGPAVTPATGPKLSLKGVSVSLPHGWTVRPAETSIQVTGVDKSLNMISIGLFPTIGNGTQGLAQSVRKIQDLPASAVRPEETLDGQPFVHLTGVSSGGGIYTDLYATALPIDGQTMLVSISYVTDDDADSLTPGDVDAIMQPVMATLKLP